MKCNRHNEQYQEHATFIDETFPKPRQRRELRGVLEATEVNTGFSELKLMFSAAKWSEESTRAGSELLIPLRSVSRSERRKKDSVWIQAQRGRKTNRTFANKGKKKKSFALFFASRFPPHRL